MYQIDFTKPIHVYFVGIGGISMSGLAEILLSRGFTVSGSDRQESPVTKKLTEQGVTVYYGQREENITPDIDLAVFTSAIHPDNPEYIAVSRLGIPMLTRAQLLGEIMRNYELPVAVSGTHGKTTTTSMLSEILLAGQTDPTLSIGGMLKSIGGNVRVGHSGYFLTEACEYTNSFLSFFPKIGIILNIDADHLDFFKDLEDIRRSFRKFAELIPADGALIINGDIPDVAEITRDLACRVISYGSGSGCDYYPEDITYDDHAHASFLLHSPASGDGKDQSGRIVLRVPGEHNLYNAIAAIAAADLMEIPRSASVPALAGFSGTDRRFEYKGTKDGVTIIDDYAHHPTEIRATLLAARNYPHGRLWCVFQPHTYTRTKSLLPEFADALRLADEVVLADIYAARETDTLGISSETLRDEILALGGSCRYFDSFSKIEEYLSSNCTKGDLLITMGAGNVNQIAEDLLS
ncbi:MAG: UDP-N-acetylmuramate--L-alanine ligase [Eubacteriales bacterium]|nr:UDP-N-acetylmuramate--L-alanine ligase [Eubacteriales bacterium]